MATSVALSTSNANVKYTISINQDSQNVSDNYSNVTVAVRFYRTNTGYSTYGTGTVYCKINGTTYSVGVSPSQKITESGIILFSREMSIPHNADGTKTLTCSAWVVHNAPLNSSEQSYSQTLSTIPRATTPSLSPISQTIGNAIVISLPRASTGFTHNLTYTFGSTSGTIATGVATSVTFNIPSNLISQIPSSVQGTGTITCNTYNGNTLIGVKTVNFIAIVPDTIVPVINSVTITEAVANIKNTFGVYVQNKSELNVATSAAGASGSSISSCIVTVAGLVYSGSDITTYIITASGNVTVKVVVTDSRGRTATMSKTVVIVPYFNPRIASFTALRCNDDGKESDEGVAVILGIDFSISSVDSKNTKSYKVQTQRQGQTTWTTILSGSVYAYNSSYVKAGNVLDSDYSYIVRLVLADSFTETVAEVQIGTAFTLMDFRSTGKGIAFGKVSQKDLLEVSMDVEFSKKLFVDSDGTIIDLMGYISGLEQSLKNINNILTNTSASTNLLNSVMTIRLSDADVKPYKSTIIPLNTLECSSVKNNCLIHQNGGIKIGTGVKKILASGGIFVTTENATQYLWCVIKKNNEEKQIGLTSTTTWFSSVSLSPVVINVTNGDFITLAKINANNDTIRGALNTWLTVQVIE